MQRTTVYFSAEDAARLDEIREKSRLQTSVAVVAAALDHYLELLEFDRAGGAIFVRPENAKDRIRYLIDDEFVYPELKSAAPPEKAEEGELASRNFVIPRNVEKKITRIKELTRHHSSSEIVRAAVASFDQLIRFRRAGGTIIVTDYKKEMPYSPFTPLAVYGLHPALQI